MFALITIQVKTHKVRPYLVANIVELLDLDIEEEQEDSAMKDVSLEVNYKLIQSRLIC